MVCRLFKPSTFPQTTGPFNGSASAGTHFNYRPIKTIPSLAYHGLRNCLLYLTEPEFQEQKLPEPKAVVTAAALVLFEKIAQETRGNEAPVQES